MKVETKYISLSFPVYSTYLAYILTKKKKKCHMGRYSLEQHRMTLLYSKNGAEQRETLPCD